jgi:hypothetical protein
VSAILGIDLRGENICTASVGESDGRTQILWLAQSPNSEKMQFPENTALGLAVPDQMVMAKNYLMRNGAGADIELRLQFEMEQSLLEDPELFQFGSVRTGLSDRFLGMIYRKERLSSLSDAMGVTAEVGSPRYLARAAALGRGYKGFCRLSGGELQGVIDIAPSDVSLCLLYRGEITMLGHLNLKGPDLDSELSLRRLAMEIKTLVSFKLASLAEMGLSLPLSNLAVAGEMPDAFIEQMARYFPSGVSRVEINRAFLADSVDSAQRPELFLPALGMTVI